jgi:predicted phage terminase large subunit-like protein
MAKAQAEVLWRPHAIQRRFLACGADEALAGGAAGGGKSASLLMGALRFVHEPTYRALLLRRTFPELEESLWGKSQLIYEQLGGVPNHGKHYWRFPSGARIWFRSIEHEKDVLRFKSDEYQYIAFDELTSFTEFQYVYLHSRLRSAAGLPCLMRGGTNPGDVGHDWVLKRWAPWLYAPGVHTDEYEGPYAQPGEVLWFSRDASGHETVVPRGTAGARSRAFFPARVADNPTLLKNDPEYVDRLQMLDRVSRAQLLDGDWMARAEPGELFRREWFEKKLVARGPGKLAKARVRYWDRAATEGQKTSGRASVKNTGPDWTAGVLMSRDVHGRIFVEDVVRFQGSPLDVENRIRATAEADKEEHGDVRIVLEQDPAAAGKFEVDQYIRRVLQGFNVHAVPARGDKVVRAKPLSAQCEHGNVYLVRGPWNEVWLAEHELFPQGKKDQVDASSGAYSQLATTSTVKASTAGPAPLGDAMGGF